MWQLGNSRVCGCIPLSHPLAHLTLKVLKALLEGVGLEPKPAAARGAEARALLSGLDLELATPELKADAEVATAALAAAAEAEVEVERAAKTLGIEAAARAAYVSCIVKAADSAEVRGSMDMFISLSCMV